MWYFAQATAWGSLPNQVFKTDKNFYCVVSETSGRSSLRQHWVFSTATITVVLKSIGGADGLERLSHYYFQSFQGPVLSSPFKVCKT